MLTEAHVHIIGDVTGVGFRAYMRTQAKQCGITGWVRNVYNKPEIFGPHGGVEAVIQGEKEAVEDMIDALKEGSEISRVDDVDVRYQEPKDVLEDFTIFKSHSYNHHE